MARADSTTPTPPNVDPLLPSTLTLRTELARILAHVNMSIAAVSLDGPHVGFASPAEMVQWRAGLDRARREVTAAERVLHDLSCGGVQR